MKLVSALPLMVILCSFTVYQTIKAEKLHTVCVVEDEEEVVREKECSGSVRNCTTFECIHEALSMHNSTQVLFLVPEIVLSSSEQFHDLSSVSFKGHSNGGPTARTVVCNKSIVKSSNEGAGLSFIRAQNLRITNMTFKYCGGRYNSTSFLDNNFTLHSRSSIHIINSTNVSIIQVEITQGIGKGLVLHDTGGTVEIEGCNFTGNTEKIDPGGGGVYVEFTRCVPGISKKCTECPPKFTGSRYRFTNCHFIDNNASLGNTPKSPSYHNTGRLYQGFGKGGGMCIYLNSGTQNTFDIKNCSFHNNVAVWAGGLYISYHGNATKNTITITNTEFKNNSAGTKGAGGASVGYSSVCGVSPNKNRVLFENCYFYQNHAAFGGGASIYTSKKSDREDSVQNEVQFIECQWVENMARIGAAVDLTPHIWTTLQSGLPIAVPEFRDCNFTRNYCVPKYYSNNSWITYRQAIGAFAATTFTVRFLGRTVFANNNGSSLYLVSSVAKFELGTEAVFEGNQGQQGGAIALIGFASLQIQENSSFVFRQNRAKVKGGAVYHMSIDYHDYLSTRSCFIQYHGGFLKPKNVTFIFENNTAQLSYSRNANSKKNQSLEFLQSNSIFTTSILPCYYACHTRKEGKDPEFNNTFDCIGNFTYLPHYNASKEIKTETHSVLPEGKVPRIFPGKKFKLPFKTYDEYNTEVVDVYQAIIDCNAESINCTMNVKESYSYIHRKMIKIFGQPHSKGKISLYQNGLPGKVISVGIEMEQCPPGFVLQGSDYHKCECSANTTTASYQGILSCNSDTFQANLQRGYWIGYLDTPHDCNTSAVKEQCSRSSPGLLSGRCPSGYCFPGSKHLHHLLPDNSNAASLDNTICGDTRTGVLCAKCREGFSVYFHRDLGSLSCHEDKLCYLGLLFYILSELVPLTLLFVLVVIFNISFTSGALNGFILFAQMYSTLDTTAHGLLLVEHEGLWIWNKIIAFVYKFFNMDFFNTSALSFCLWRGATSLDILAMKYVTMAYALLLIVIMVVVMNATCLYRFCNFMRPQKVRKSVIHGLSAFLVMCYAQCAKVTFKILTSTILYNSEKASQKTVSLFYGEIDYFSKEHLPYAIPAMFCLIFVLILLPFLLLVYPNSYRVLALLGINESVWFRKVSKFFPLNKMMPLFDSFQSCFKSNARFFSGLYFAYRLVLLASSAFSMHKTFYIVILALFLVMLMLHALVQPYVVKWHNTVDTLIFTDLALINALTLYNYMNAKLHVEVHQARTDTIFALQCVLASLPLLYLLVFLLYRPSIHIWKMICSTKAQDDQDELPARLLEEDFLYSESTLESGSDYHSHKDNDSMM